MPAAKKKDIPYVFPGPNGGRCVMYRKADGNWKRRDILRMAKSLLSNAEAQHSWFSIPLEEIVFYLERS